MRKQDYETVGSALARAVNQIAPRLHAGDEEAILNKVCETLWLDNPGFCHESLRAAYNQFRDQEAKTS